MPSSSKRRKHYLRKAFNTPGRKMRVWGQIKIGIAGNGMRLSLLLGNWLTRSQKVNIRSTHQHEKYSHARRRQLTYGRFLEPTLPCAVCFACPIFKVWIISESPGRDLLCRISPSHLLDPLVITRYHSRWTRFALLFTRYRRIKRCFPWMASQDMCMNP